MKQRIMILWVVVGLWGGGCRQRLTVDEEQFEKHCKKEYEMLEKQSF